MKISFTYENEIEIHNPEYEFQLTDEDFCELNKGVKNLNVKFIPRKEIGCATGTEVLITVFATILKQMIEDGSIEIFVSSLVQIMRKLSCKYKNSMDPTPYLTLSIKIDDGELNLNLGNMSDSDEVKMDAITKTMETVKEFIKHIN